MGNRVEDHLWQALALYKSKWEGERTNVPQLLFWAWRNGKLVYLQVWWHHLSENFMSSVEAVLIDWFRPDERTGRVF